MVLHKMFMLHFKLYQCVLDRRNKKLTFVFFFLFYEENQTECPLILFHLLIRAEQNEYSLKNQFIALT